MPLDRGGDAEQDGRRTHAVQAVTLLRQAFAAGYKDAAHMRKDTDLNALRSRPDFQKLLEELEKKQERGGPVWW